MGKEAVASLSHTSKPEAPDEKQVKMCVGKEGWVSLFLNVKASLKF